MHARIGKYVQIVVMILTALLLINSACPVAAQSDDVWGTPINVSRSGAATQPVLIAGSDGTARALWWDAFEGIATARYDGETWQSADFAPIQIVEEVNNDAVIREPSVMPTIFGDINGISHAFWLDIADEETDLRPLMHSRLTADGTAWSTPQAIAASAVAWQMVSSPNGVLHLAYVRTTHSTVLPAGIYYRRSTNGGQTWTPAVPLHTTIYFRLVEADAAYLTLAAGTTGGVAVAWTDPEQEMAAYVISTDGGASWSAPSEITAPREMSEAGSRATQPRFAFLASGEILRLWEAAPAMMGCAIYQQLSRDGGATWSAPERVLDNLTRCPETVHLKPLPQGDLMAELRDEDGGLTLTAAEAITNSEGVERIRWAAPKSLAFTFQDGERENAIYLDDLNVITINAGGLLIAGHGPEDEIWTFKSQQEMLSWAFAPSSPWTGPSPVAQRDISAESPAIAVDTEGQIHLLWSENNSPLQYARQNKIRTTSGGETLRWSAPAEVLGTADHSPAEPALVTTNGHLHAVWSDGNEDTILHAYAFVDDASMRSGWSRPQTVGAGSSPALTRTPEGVLHLAFAIPWNEQRGIYYTSWEGEEEAWSRPSLIFDARAEGWTMVDNPAIAVDALGNIHVTWTRGGWQDRMLPRGIYYAHSRDGGETWSDPTALAEGTYEASRLAMVQGQIHVVWSDASAQDGLYHRWSSDHGTTWARATRMATFEGVQRDVALLSDGAEVAHLLGLRQDDVGAWHLLHTIWKGEGWERAETLELGFEYRMQRGVSAALQPTLGELAVIFRSHATDEEGEARTEILAAARTVSATQTLTSTALSPTPTAATTPRSTPIPTATPRPEIDSSRPPSSEQAVTLGPLAIPLTAVGGILMAVALVAFILFYQLVIARQH